MADEQKFTIGTGGIKLPPAPAPIDETVLLGEDLILILLDDDGLPLEET